MTPVPDPDWDTTMAPIPDLGARWTVAAETFENGNRCWTVYRDRTEVADFLKVADALDYIEWKQAGR